MKFIDVATVQVRAGDGGNGRTSFRKEKFVDRGGPDGGDGGDGGSVIFTASRNHNTLVSFRYQKELTAKPGGNGGKTRMHGRNGASLTVSVPVGTVVFDGDAVVVDLVTDGQTAVVARGGRGGFGNAHFVSSVRQAPKFAEPGEPGESRELRLELKLIADVGLVGLPNAGKSTFLSVVSNARPEIADYPFTTLTPNLGVADISETDSLLIADIPGLIEGAAEGKGLGDEFLRHVERTAVLLHLLDASSEDVVRDYHIIQNELKSYAVNLASRAKIVVLTKIDACLPEQITVAQQQLKKIIPPRTELYAISSQSHQGVCELLFATLKLVQAERKKQADTTKDVTQGLPVLKLADETGWTIAENEGVFTVSGSVIDKFVVRTDFGNQESINRLRDIMRRHGIMHDLVRHGATPGATIVFTNAKKLEL